MQVEDAGAHVENFTIAERAFPAIPGPQPAINTWYTTRVRWTQPIVPIGDPLPDYLWARKTWVRGTAEPDFQIEGTTPQTTDPVIAITLIFRAFGSGPATPQQAEFDNVRFGIGVGTGKPCFADGPLPAPAPMPNPLGYLCENPSRLSSTGYATSWAFVALSTRVYVDGLFQRPGHEYTESNPAAGGITFAAPVSSSSDVRICYFVANPIGGSTP